VSRPPATRRRLRVRPRSFTTSATNAATNTTAIIGNAIASTETPVAPAASPVATSGLPKPAVVTDDAARRLTVATCTRPAVPPPAIAASVHARSGDMSVKTETETTVPATTAAGVATVSRRLSTHGT